MPVRYKGFQGQAGNHAKRLEAAVDVELGRLYQCQLLLAQTLKLKLEAAHAGFSAHGDERTLEKELEKLHKQFTKQLLPVARLQDTLEMAEGQAKLQLAELRFAEVTVASKHGSDRESFLAYRLVLQEEGESEARSARVWPKELP